MICIIEQKPSFTDPPQGRTMDVSSGSPPARPTPPPLLRRIASAELMAGRREIAILHDGQEYRLRITAAGKLILTK
jgi:hemin uptake protein HemP